MTGPVHRIVNIIVTSSHALIIEFKLHHSANTHCNAFCLKACYVGIKFAMELSVYSVLCNGRSVYDVHDITWSIVLPGKGGHI